MNSTTNYVKVATYEGSPQPGDTVLLLYSGGLDTSTILKWLQDSYKVKVITLTVDIGQQADDLTVIAKKAKKLGAIKTITIDAKQKFAEHYISHAIKANAQYQGEYYLSTPLGRAIISEIAVHQAQQYNVAYIAHGCTGKGNDQVRFETYITTLNPNLKVIAPVREWSMGRDEQIVYAEKHGIPIQQSANRPYSYDDNMWGSTAEGGEIEHPEEIAPLDNILKVTASPEEWPDAIEQITIGFEYGSPVSINGISMQLHDIISQLNNIGGKHGVGVTQLIEDRLVGLKVRGVYEQPGAHIIISAHQDLEKLVSTRTENEFKLLVDQKWSYLCYGAQWFEPTIQHLNAYCNDMNKKVTGSVTVQLFKGQCTVVSLVSPYSLFNHNLATFNKNMAFNQNASAGFIELFALPQKTAYQVSKRQQHATKLDY